jgi:zinc transporter ZupT
MSSSIDENVGIALGLVVGAGAATGLGAAVVFIPSLVKLASRRVLAGSLGFSAGVMSYVSFIEIFSKANQSFVDAGHAKNKAYMYSTVCFFGGVVTMIVSEDLGGQQEISPPWYNLELSDDSTPTTIRCQILFRFLDVELLCCKTARRSQPSP